jgi:proteic killer suppression protein
MILSYGDKDIKLLYEKYKCPRWLPGELLIRAYSKLFLLDAATTEKDLTVPPSNYYEHLQGNKAGLSSIRINIQWRLVFRWNSGNAYDVVIEDYHK